MSSVSTWLPSATSHKYASYLFITNSPLSQCGIYCEPPNRNPKPTSFHDIPDNVEPTRRMGYHKHANANWRLTLKYLYVLHTIRDAKVTQRPILNVGDKCDSFRASLLLFPPWFASSVFLCIKGSATSAWFSTSTK